MYPDVHRLALLKAIYIAGNQPTMNCRIRNLHVLPTIKRSTNTATTLQQPIRQCADKA